MNPNETSFLKKHGDLLQSGGVLLVGSVLLSGAAFAALSSFDVVPEEVQTAIAINAIPAPNAYENIRLIGESAIVYDLVTGETLYAQDADRALPLASITKLLTMYAATGTLQDASPVSITPEALAQEGESGFTEGETFAFKDLARLTLVASSNDGAAAIADAAAISKNMDDAELLQRAAALAGLSHTRAENATGLDISTTEAGAYGSARDVATLAGKLLAKAPAIAGSTVARSITVRSQDGTVHTLPNTNQDVVHVSGILLSKTGYTDLAGGNLVVIYDAGFGHPVAVVVLGSSKQGRFIDVENLIRATGAHFAGVSDSSI
ncbi:MAG: D-alanyl-D-alanine carboxypeptidase (penicillin-binding protein 5/6) [Parcubacteria bacterium C7867-008]|nr:MAG: D-alanyl-D-alanine carboxypeptidase (penicillin-binding protein 5/6) [Parcubacteria bacterium C7867-008]